MSAVAADIGATDHAVTDGGGTARIAPTDFESLFREHYERLVRALTIVAGDRVLAEDAVQDAFVRAHVRWRRISRYDDPAGWVRRVALNRLRDEHRRDTRKSRALMRLRYRSPAAHETPEIDEFGRLLAELPQRQRAATALYYVDGLAIEDIATALGISQGTVKSHLHDARQRLRPLLDREEQR